ncbi:MAG TPA: ribonuclease P protein component [Kiritimatiellia bacterium]|nr:ribonuclease P protein component [Kiritimatiellia bacterium]HRU71802.1 ribonuclease P protein component [Kiritimatiellia bacterium]
MNGSAPNGDGPLPLPGPFRLDASKYARIFARKRPVYGRTLVMWVSRGTDAGRRAGVVVSKRTFRRAVDRNRAKRLLREVFRLSRHRLAPDVDVILIARAGIAGKRCQEVMRDLEAVYVRAKVLAGG